MFAIKINIVDRLTLEYVYTLTSCASLFSFELLVLAVRWGLQSLCLMIVLAHAANAVGWQPRVFPKMASA